MRQGHHRVWSTTCRHLRRVALYLLCCWGALNLFGGSAPAALACEIDGQPSMALNGHLVSTNSEGATKENLTYWAPFVLGTARAQVALRFSEDATKLHKALTAQAFAHPFQWSFGDGATALGLAVRHHYGQPGWYKVNVSYYYPPQRTWLVFDSAELHIPGAAAGAQAGSPSATRAAALAGSALLLLGALGVTTISLRRRRLHAETLRRDHGRYRARGIERRGRVAGRR